MEIIFSLSIVAGISNLNSSSQSQHNFFVQEKMSEFGERIIDTCSANIDRLLFRQWYYKKTKKEKKLCFDYDFY